MNVDDTIYDDIFTEDSVHVKGICRIKYTKLADCYELTMFTSDGIQSIKYSKLDSLSVINTNAGSKKTANYSVIFNAPHQYITTKIEIKNIQKICDALELFKYLGNLSKQPSIADQFTYSSAPVTYTTAYIAPSTTTHNAPSTTSSNNIPSTALSETSSQTNQLEHKACYIDEYSVECPCHVDENSSDCPRVMHFRGRVIEQNNKVMHFYSRIIKNDADEFSNYKKMDPDESRMLFFADDYWWQVHIEIGDEKLTITLIDNFSNDVSDDVSDDVDGAYLSDDESEVSLSDINFEKFSTNYEELGISCNAWSSMIGLLTTNI